MRTYRLNLTPVHSSEYEENSINEVIGKILQDHLQTGFNTSTYSSKHKRVNKARDRMLNLQSEVSTSG